MNLTQKSFDIIHAGQATNGAYAACESFSQYNYSWLRDGAWIAYGMDCADQHQSARKFYQWGVHVLLRYTHKVDVLIGKLDRGEQPLETDYLPTRFALDGGLGQEDWPDFQLDGYGAWLWGLVQHCRLSDFQIWEEARPAIELLVRYLEALWQSPNYDCWEEHRDQIHTATLAALYGGLTAVQEVDPTLVPYTLPTDIRTYILEHCVAEEGHFMKSIGNSEVDASLLWVAVPYRVVTVDDPRFTATLNKIERDIHRPQGGVYRYAKDTYFGAGEWILLTAWLGWVYTELGQPETARELYRWIEQQAQPDGELPEQVSDHTLYPDYYQPWVERWGTPAKPLLWSHGMYLVLQNRLKESAL